MSQNVEWYIVGVMSGSSLDGIDLALCSFSSTKKKIKYKILKTETIPYSPEWKERLGNAGKLGAKDFVQLDFDYGKLLADTLNRFIGKDHVDIIGSHGHTVFHSPDTAMTCQIGHGAVIASETQRITVCDFRSQDLALGGQGAPITSLFDLTAFGEFNYVINLGGICNISILSEENDLLSFDIGPCNQLLNYLATYNGEDFDKNGRIARQGKINQELLDELLNDPYFDKNPPKSLSNQYVWNHFISKLDGNNDSIENKMRTSVEFILTTIQKVIENHYVSSTLFPGMMLTGGGAHNTFLVEMLREKLPQMEINLPKKEMIDYKEAIMIAFMAFKRVNGNKNILSVFTGARQDTVSGAIYN